jgi:hypothetical protein
VPSSAATCTSARKPLRDEPNQEHCVNCRQAGRECREERHNERVLHRSAALRNRSRDTSALISAQLQRPSALRELSRA